MRASQDWKDEKVNRPGPLLYIDAGNFGPTTIIPEPALHAGACVRGIGIVLGHAGVCKKDDGGVRTYG